MEHWTNGLSLWKDSLKRLNLLIFRIPFNSSKIHIPQGLPPPGIGTEEIGNWTKQTRAFKVSIWPQKPLFYAFFGGFDPGESFFYCIKISRNIENEGQQYNAIIRENAEEFVVLNW